VVIDEEREKKRRDIERKYKNHNCYKIGGKKEKKR